MRPLSFARRSPRSGKAFSWLLGAVALALFACCGSVGFFTMQANKKKQEALAEGDRLYSTKTAEAIAKYKEGYDDAGDRKAEVLQRIVDHEATNGNTAEAVKWVDKGLDDRLAVACTSIVAKDLHAKARKERDDRDAAKRAEKVAQAKQREDEKGARDQVRTNKNLSREQFRALVGGKTEQQVLDALGKPDETPDQEGLGKLWYYLGAPLDQTASPNLLVGNVTRRGTDHRHLPARRAAPTVCEGSRRSILTRI